MSGAIQLEQCSYGKSGVRLVKVEREGTCHDLRDITVDVQVFGVFENAYLEGDNRSVLPTDTMKNTVYVLARQHRLEEPEAFGTRLAEHFLAHYRHLTQVRVTLSENTWNRILCGGAPHDSAFQKSGPESCTAVIEASRTKRVIRGGMKNLALLKTSGSAFNNFLRDEYTTLRETSDRLFASNMNVEWSYNHEVRDFKEIRQCIQTTLLNTFAGHDSQSAQHTLYAMGRAVLERVNAVDEICLALPNRHCLPVDLSPFGLDNPNEVFVPIEEPSGLIEARLNRKCPAG
jgi:urate oxidase